MSGLIDITINGRRVRVEANTTIAAALLNDGVTSFRTSCKNGEPRAPLCGMGICYDCRALVDGAPHARTCQILCRPGMCIETEAPA